MIRVETWPLLAPCFGWRAHPSPLNCENKYLVFALGRKLQRRQNPALSSGRHSGAKSKGVGRWAPAATRFIAYALIFPFPFFEGYVFTARTFFALTENGTRVVPENREWNFGNSEWINKMIVGSNRLTSNWSSVSTCFREKLFWGFNSSTTRSGNKKLTFG